MADLALRGLTQLYPGGAEAPRDLDLEVSAGEQQRVALARAMLRRPRVLRLDEPLAHLDGPRCLELRGQLHLLQRRLGATMVVVTHEQDEALGLADRVAVLDGGRLVQVGSPRELLDQPASDAVARPLGSPPVRLVPGDPAPDGRPVLGLRRPYLFDADTGRALRDADAAQRQAPNP